MAPETFGITDSTRAYECVPMLAEWLRGAEIRLAELESECDRAQDAIDSEDGWNTWKNMQRVRRRLEQAIVKAKLLHVFFAEVVGTTSNYVDEVDWPRR
jgi:hypothetical protein